MIRSVPAPVSAPLLDDLADLMARAYAPTGMRAWRAGEIGDMVRGKSSILLIAHAGSEEPTGFLLASVLEDEIEILVLAVCPQFHRRGIASQLVRELNRCIIETSRARIILEVADTNKDAISLYEMLRFADIGTRRNYYRIHGRKVDARVMEKRFVSH